MQCPVCNKSGIPDGVVSCPECHSDLQSLNLLDQIGKIHKNRLYLSVTLAILLIAVVIVWIITGPGVKSSEISASPPAGSAASADQALVQDLRAEIATLKVNNEKLSDELAQLKTKKETEYMVKEGESLFMIARKIYGNGFKYTEIATANNISDPDRILTGQKLKIYY